MAVLLQSLTAYHDKMESLPKGWQPVRHGLYANDSGVEWGHLPKSSWCQCELHKQQFSLSGGRSPSNHFTLYSADSKVTNGIYFIQIFIYLFPCTDGVVSKEKWMWQYQRLKMCVSACTFMSVHPRHQSITGNGITAWLAFLLLLKYMLWEWDMELLFFFLMQWIFYTERFFF